MNLWTIDDVPIKFKTLENKMDYTTTQCDEILKVSIDTIKKLARGKTKFKGLYERLKELNLL